MKKLLLAVALGMSVLAAGSAAEASTIYVSENEMGPYGTNFYTGGTLGPWPSDFNGQMIATANMGSSLASPTFDLIVWCIDQIGYIGLGPNPSFGGATGITYQVGSLDDFTTDFRGNSITQRQAREIAALVNIAQGLLSVPAADNAIVANAVQAAITNIEYGTTSDGGVAVNAKTLELLALVSGLTDAQLSGYQATILYNATSGSAIGAQALMTASAIPEPSTIALLGFGLLGLRLIRSKQDSRR